MRRYEMKMFFGPLIGAAIFIVVATKFLLPRIAVTPQKVSDLLLNAIAAQNLNKSAEMTLFYVLLSLAVIFVAFMHYRVRLNWPMKTGTPVSAIEKMAWLCFVPMVFYYIMRGQLVPYYAYIFLCLFMLYVYDKKQIYINIAMLANLYIASIALIAIKYTIFPDLTSSNRVIQKLILGFAAISPGILTVFMTGALFIILFTIKNRCTERKAGYSLVAFPQLLAPFALLTFLVDRYMVENKLLTLPFDRPYVYAVWVLISLLFLHSAYCFYKFIIKGKLPEARRLIFPSTIAVFLILSSTDAPNLLISGDWIHWPDNHVPFEQVYSFGKTLYDDFLLGSGCFAMVYGFITDIFLDGTAISFLQAQDLCALVSVTVSAFLLYHVFGSEMALLCSLPLWGFETDYNRVLPLLPFILLLFLAKIVKNKNLWLQVYMLCSLLLALYYPLYGIAYCLGGLPFALLQLYGIVKNQDYGSRAFYISWLLCLAIIVYFAPLTIRLAKYTLTLSSETLVSHGIALADNLFGNSPYLPYIPTSSLKATLMQGIRFAYQGGIILFFTSGLCIYLFSKKNTRPLNPLLFLGLSLPLIFMLFASHHTLILPFFDSPFTKINDMVPVVSIIFAGALWKYAQPLFRPGILVPLLAALMAVNYTFASYNLTFTSHLKSFRSVPYGYTAVSDDLLARAPKFGRGLINSDAIAKFTRYERILGSIATDNYHLSDNDASPLINMIFGKPMSSSTWPGRLLGEDWQNIVISCYKKDQPVVLAVRPFSQYLIYRYLLENYVLLNEMFVPRKLVPSIKNPTPTPFPALVKGYQSLHNRANFMGRSFEHLKHRFDLIPIIHQTFRQESAGTLIFDVSLPEKLRGDEADFIYVKFSPGSAKKLRIHSWGALGQEPQEVTVAWPDEDNPDKPHTMLMAYETGEFLIPLGANPYWLTNSHSGFTITVTNPEALAKNVSMEELLFLRLKQ